MTQTNRPLTKEDIKLAKSLDISTKDYSFYLYDKEIVLTEDLRQALQGLLDAGYCKNCEKRVTKKCLKESHIIKYLTGDIYYWLGALLK